MRPTSETIAAAVGCGDGGAYHNGGGDVSCPRQAAVCVPFLLQVCKPTEQAMARYTTTTTTTTTATTTTTTATTATASAAATTAATAAAISTTIATIITTIATTTATAAPTATTTNNDNGHFYTAPVSHQQR